MNTTLYMMSMDVSSCKAVVACTHGMAWHGMAFKLIVASETLHSASVSDDGPAQAQKLVHVALDYCTVSVGLCCFMQCNPE